MAQAATRGTLALGPDYRDEGWGFCWQDGTGYHPEYLTKTFRRLAHRAGLPPAKLHSLRHAYAHLLISAGEDIAVVSRLLGRSSIRISADLYGGVYEAKGRDAAAKAAALVPRAQPAVSG